MCEVCMCEVGMCEVGKCVRWVCGHMVISTDGRQDIAIRKDQGEHKDDPQGAVDLGSDIGRVPSQETGEEEFIAQKNFIFFLQHLLCQLLQCVSYLT